MVDLTVKQFKDKQEQGDHFFVVFSAPWCGQCRRLKGVLRQVESKLKVTFYALNVDDMGDLVNLYDIETIPVLSVFRGHAQEGLFINPPSRKHIEDFINCHTDK